MNILGGQFQPDAGFLRDQHVNSAAAIAATKMQHAYKAETNFALKIGDTPVTSERLVHVASQAGTVSSFNALLNAVGSASSMTFDLKKNGTSILSAPITVSSASDTDRQVVTATIASPTFVAGDVFSIALVVSTSTGAQGPFAWAGIIENGAP